MFRGKLGSYSNEFCRDYSRSIIFALIGVILMMLVMASVVLYQIRSRPLPPFSAVTPDKKILALPAYDEPNLVPGVLLKWASKAAVAAYTFDFVNYDKEIALARPYFTNAGWKAYQSAIQAVIDRVKAGQIFVSGVASGAPVISNQGPLLGHGYTWRVQIPFLVTFQSSEETEPEHYIVVMMIVRVPTSVNPQGIGIDQFSMVRP